MDWKKFKPYVFAILLDPRQKMPMLEQLAFSEPIRRDIRLAFLRIYQRYYFIIIIIFFPNYFNFLVTNPSTKKMQASNTLFETPQLTDQSAKNDEDDEHNIFKNLFKDRVATSNKSEIVRYLEELPINDKIFLLFQNTDYLLIF